MKVSVKVPATSANIGPGFDCLGLALPIYNTVTIEETVLPGTGIEINMISEEEVMDEMIFDDIPKDENNIVYRAVEMLYNSIGQEPSELKINIQSQIPITRGLGSSAAVIVGGLIAANKLLGSPADETALLSLATEVEGHPDNVAPAILGGFVLSSQEDDGTITYRKLDWPQEWDITVCIPDFELSTNIARSVLPENVPLQDAVYNAKHLAMLIEAVNSKDEKLMKIALHDKLHQPYREKLVPGMKEIMEAFKHEDGVLGCVLSGAGPTMLIISHKYDLDKIKSIVKDIWEKQNIKVDVSDFIDDMAAAYAWADVVICRSGALTVCEIAAAGVPAIFVPFQHKDQQQYLNARYLADAGAAEIIQQAELTPERVVELLQKWERPTLLAMAEKAQSKAAPTAAQRVAETIISVTN